MAEKNKKINVEQMSMFDDQENSKKAGSTSSTKTVKKSTVHSLSFETRLPRLLLPFPFGNLPHI